MTLQLSSTASTAVHGCSAKRTEPLIKALNVLGPQLSSVYGQVFKEALTLCMAVLCAVSVLSL